MVRECSELRATCRGAVRRALMGSAGGPMSEHAYLPWGKADFSGAGEHVRELG
jgi:hypothetical protein